MKNILVLSVCLLLLVKWSGSNVYHFQEVHKLDSRPISNEGLLFCISDGVHESYNMTEEVLREKMKILSDPTACNDTCDPIMKSYRCSGSFYTCASYCNVTECYTKEFYTYPHFDLLSSYEKAKGNDSSIQNVNCSYPNPLKTAAVECSKENDTVYCTQKCLYGYELEDGAIREMNCKYEENVWRPKGFEECRPTVDCSLRLSAPGKLSCSPAGMNSSFSCSVSCGKYGNQTAVPEERHFCGLDGQWSPKLPFCVFRAAESLTPVVEHDIASRCY